MSSGKEVDLLTLFLGKGSEMDKVSFLTDAIESYDGPLRWSLPIGNSVLGGTRIESSDVIFCQSSGPRSLQEILEYRIFCLTHLLREEYHVSEMSPDRSPQL